MQIKDYPLINAISDNDLLLVQTQIDGAYKSISASDLKAYFHASSGNTSVNSTVFMSNFSSIVDTKGHLIASNGSAQITSTQSKFNNQSLSLPGNGSYLQLASNADWNLTADFTIEAWVYPTSSNTNDGDDHVLASTALFNSSGWQLEINSATSGGNKAISFFINQYQNRQYLNLPEWIGSWKYVAIKRTSGTLEIWVDGTQQLSVSGYTFDSSNTESLVIGRAGLNWDAPHYFKGYCGGLKISKSALDVSTVPIQAFSI